MSDEVTRHLNEVSRLIDQNNLNQVDYDSDMLERVRDDCTDFLKAIEVGAPVPLEGGHAAALLDLNEKEEATSDVKVREIQPINSKSGLDRNAERSARL